MKKKKLKKENERLKRIVTELHKDMYILIESKDYTERSIVEKRWQLKYQINSCLWFGDINEEETSC